MNVLDENFPPSMGQLLRSWRIHVQHIGYDIGRKGMKDDEIVHFLLSLRRPTFFTLDADFYRPSLCHSQYCLVYLGVEQIEAAVFVRRLLHHSEFDTQTKRMGTVIRASSAGLSVWRLHAERPMSFAWASI